MQVEAPGPRSPARGTGHLPSPHPVTPPVEVSFLRGRGPVFTGGCKEPGSGFCRSHPWRGALGKETTQDGVAQLTTTELRRNSSTPPTGTAETRDRPSDTGQKEMRPTEKTQAVRLPGSRKAGLLLHTGAVTGCDFRQATSPVWISSSPPVNCAGVDKIPDCLWGCFQLLHPIHQ